MTTLLFPAILIALMYMLLIRPQRQRVQRQRALVSSLAVGLLALTFITDSHPVLGLDLRGGVSVVLKPTKSNVASSSISKAVDIIRSRVDALGVAEPDISRQGQNVVISLPGVKDPDRALTLVGQTAELRFRPVLQQLQAGAPPPKPPAQL